MTLVYTIPIAGTPAFAKSAVIHVAVDGKDAYDIDIPDGATEAEVILEEGDLVTITLDYLDENLKSVTSVGEQIVAGATNLASGFLRTATIESLA